MMNKLLLLFLAICAFATAMVPRNRRALNSDEEEFRLTSTSENPKTFEICAPQTPCSWSIYTPNIKIIEVNITNTYCVCGPGTTCQYIEDDPVANAYVYRCRSVGETVETPES